MHMYCTYIYIKHTHTLKQTRAGVPENILEPKSVVDGVGSPEIQLNETCFGETLRPRRQCKGGIRLE